MRRNILLIRFFYIRYILVPKPDKPEKLKVNINLK